AELRFLDGIEGSLNSVDVEGESEETVSVIASTNRSYGQIETTLKLTTDSVSENVTVPVNIRASEEQKQEVNERIKQYESRLRYLKANMTKLEEDGADQELIDQMDAEIGDFEERLQQINASIAEDRYYEIASSIDEVESQRSEAVNTTETVKEQHRQNEQRFWMILFTVSTLGILGGGAFVWYRSDYYLDTDDLPVDLENISFEDIEWDETVEKLEDKLDNLLEGDGGQKPSEDSRDLSWD
ncbi:MAG: DNA repair exonuclease SbcCD ATPase subunit, partial [Candidatus Nanohaloarchaea archaeon]